MPSEQSRRILGSKGRELDGRRIILCVTGSISAIRSPDVARELMRHGAEVYAVMSDAAEKIIHPYALEWATGNPVITEITGRIENVELLGESPARADLVLIAPATDNTIGKVTHGVNDTPVTAMALTALGAGVPLVVCPAMHEPLFTQPILRENVQRLRALGVEFVEPLIAENKAKLAPVERIVERVICRLTPQDLEGKRILVTGGPTQEPIDAIRILTNRSSGKMAVALCVEARRRGGEVCLVYGPGSAEPPPDIRVIRVTTSREMAEAVERELRESRYDVFVAAAAVSDFSPVAPRGGKIPSRPPEELTLRLKPTGKIIDAVKRLSPSTFLVAFKAEFAVSDEELVEACYERLQSSGADLIVGNDVARRGAGFGEDTNEAVMVDREKAVLKVGPGSKQELAKAIFDQAVKRLGAS